MGEGSPWRRAPFFWPIAGALDRVLGGASIIPPGGARDASDASGCLFLANLPSAGAGLFRGGDAATLRVGRSTLVEPYTGVLGDGLRDAFDPRHVMQQQ